MTTLSSLSKKDFLGCEDCDYLGNSFKNLEKHRKSKHEGIKFNCDKCEFKGTQISVLNVHIRFHHEGIKFECDKCDFN